MSVKFERHPYGEYFPSKPKIIIIGSFPIGKFSNPSRRHEIKPHEHNFFFGGEKNLLWKILSKVFEFNILSTQDIMELLEKEGMAIGDLIKGCRRKDGGGSDSDLYDIEWNKNLLLEIRKRKIKKIFFTSRKVEQWFYKLFPVTPDLIKVTLISPSGQSVRFLSNVDHYRSWKKRNPKGKAIDYLILDYKKKFRASQKAP